jgi:hypothetical protein
VSGRLILRKGAAGSYSVGAVSPGTSWQFADGYTVGSFQEFLTIVNPGGRQAHVHLHLVSDQGHAHDNNLTVPASSRRTVLVADLLQDTAVSASITSDVPVVAERLQQFGSVGQGVTTTIGTPSGSTTLYVDPGHLPNRAQGHLSLYNPGDKPATVMLSIINTHGQTVRTLSKYIAARHRATVDLTARYGTANLGAIITSDVPVVAEKVAYFGQFKKSIVGGSDLMGIAAPSSHEVFPGGTTANGGTNYLNLYNPSTSDASVLVTAVFGGSQTSQRTIQVPAQRRVSVDVSTLGVPVGPSSLIVDGVQGAQVFATQSIFNKSRTDGSEVSGVVAAEQQ